MLALIKIKRAYLTVGALLCLAILRPSFHLPSPPLANHIKVDEVQGIDISHYQGQLEWQKLPEDIQFVFIKATEGETYVDPMMLANIQGAKGVKKPWGLYHFYRPKDDPKVQAHHFLRALPEAAIPLRPVLDVEVTDNVSPEQLRKGVKVWLEIVEQAVGCAPAIYASRSFYDDYLGVLFNGYDYWLAEYSQALKLPETREHWLAWQYTQQGRVLGVKHVVDRDRVNTHRKLDGLKCKP